MYMCSESAAFLLPKHNTYVMLIILRQKSHNFPLNRVETFRIYHLKFEKEAVILFSTCMLLKLEPTSIYKPSQKLEAVIDAMNSLK